ncbi:hypothetical protein JHK82_032796 [Glycine max]|nr:hypothetical protein JHK82_032796 [Glycine max]KAG5139358.1 hypothetical protein JHK84_033126 [Glycine max]
MKDQEMPEGVQGLKHKSEESFVTSTQVANEKKVFSKEEFELRSNILAYEDDDIDTKENTKHMKDFEPRPNILTYNNDEDIDATN